MCLERQAQIKAETQSQAQVGVLIFDKVCTEILAEYFDYSNIFSTKNVVELQEHFGINDHAIKLEEDKQPAFGPIYNLGPLKLEILKTYIKTNLANNFICSSKSPAGAFILFNWKLDRNLRFCIDY